MGEFEASPQAEPCYYQQTDWGFNTAAVLGRSRARVYTTLPSAPELDVWSSYLVDVETAEKSQVACLRPRS